MLEIVLHGEKIGEFAGFPITNTMIMAWFATGVLVLFGLAVRKRTALIPGRFQGAVEGIIGGLQTFMNDILGDSKKTSKYFAFIATLLLFIMTNNWLALLPGLGAMGITEHTEHGEIFIPLFRTTNSDLNMTLILAIAAVFMIQVFGVGALGIFKYGHKFFRNPIKDPIGAFTGILELVSEIARMISFSFRLFGNIFAGEVLLIIISFLLPYGAPLPFLFLELFVGFIQALVFATLTLVFIKIATVDH
jgi:F-type H+-transporting ATPase subunit a